MCNLRGPRFEEGFLIGLSPDELITPAYMKRVNKMSSTLAVVERGLRFTTKATLLFKAVFFKKTKHKFGYLKAFVSILA